VLTIICLVIFSGMMVWAAISDIRYYILSNRLNMAIAVLYPVYLLCLSFEYAPLPWQEIAWAFGIALIIFLFCFGLFAIGAMGGGDVKMIPLVAIWAGPALVMDFLLITTLVGGVFSAVLIVKKRLKKASQSSKSSKSSENINLLMSEKGMNKVPYGVGIALGGLYVSWMLYAALGQ